VKRRIGGCGIAKAEEGVDYRGPQQNANCGQTCLPADLLRDASSRTIAVNASCEPRLQFRFCTLSYGRSCRQAEISQFAGAALRLHCDRYFTKVPSSAGRYELCCPRSPNAIVMSIERRNCMAGQSLSAARLDAGPVFQSQPIRRNSSDSRQRDSLSPRKISL
jgi:hypothetical protein